MVVSQPLAATPSQSPRPAGHMMLTSHAPDLHTAVAHTGGSGQRVPHAPQLFVSPDGALRSVSQPSEAVVLQSP